MREKIQFWFQRGQLPAMRPGTCLFIWAAPLPKPMVCNSPTHSEQLTLVARTWISLKQITQAPFLLEKNDVSQKLMFRYLSFQLLRYFLQDEGTSAWGHTATHPDVLVIRLRRLLTIHCGFSCKPICSNEQQEIKVLCICIVESSSQSSSVLNLTSTLLAF